MTINERLAKKAFESMCRAALSRNGVPGDCVHTWEEQLLGVKDDWMMVIGEVVKDERDANAALCEQVRDDAINAKQCFSGDANSNYAYGAEECAARIRARGSV